VLQLSPEKLIVHTGEDPGKIFNAINVSGKKIDDTSTGSIDIKNRLQKEEYISIVEKLRGHILKGDCYEINFCQEFFANDAVIDPLWVYSKLSSLSPNPFSALYKLHDKYCICASPERYLKKKGSLLISQPIKGTSKRDLTDTAIDKTNRQQLLQSEKDRSENTMIVDLVRNDMSKVCRKGSVTVSELFGVYSFPQVHQMISTIQGEVDDAVNWVDIIKATFPMGSMTGAPKKRVMELIEKYERTRRGLFSGAIGYMMPGGDFDFNVVIRSILYNASTQFVSYQAGSAITFNSNAEEEYKECLVKVAAIKDILHPSLNNK
jgi:para-aminobenzoate synthetase component I